MSRTPVRSALARLEEEGFLEALPGGGYAVKTFTEQEAFDAIEIRGTLEGLACRLAAERGVEPAKLALLDQLVTDIDILLAKPKMSTEDFRAYTRMNESLHQALAEACGGKVLSRQIERAPGPALRPPLRLRPGPVAAPGLPHHLHPGPGPPPGRGRRHPPSRGRPRGIADARARPARGPQPARGHRQPARAGLVAGGQLLRTGGAA
ncbi:MAG: GntR family transcriptional regulator [Caulobacteraceae bacterium]